MTSPALHAHGKGEGSLQPVRTLIRVATPADIESIHSLLRDDFRWAGAAQAIERLLTHRWGPEGTPHALVAEVDGRVVGFIATILSRWPRRDEVIDDDNISKDGLLGSFSFYHVHPDNRASSLLLLRAALSHAGRWTSLTPNAYSQAILKMAGFRVMSEGFRFFTAGGGGWRRGGWRAHRATHEELRTAGLVRLAGDHSQYGCGIYSAACEDERIIVVTKRRFAGSGRVRLPVSEVLFASAPEVLPRAWPALVPVVAWHDRTPLIALDDVFDPRHLIAGGRMRPRFRMMRGFAQAEHLDALYSELVLLS